MNRIHAPVLGIYGENDARINAALPDVTAAMRSTGRRSSTRSIPAPATGSSSPAARATTGRSRSGPGSGSWSSIARGWGSSAGRLRSIVECFTFSWRSSRLRAERRASLRHHARAQRHRRAPARRGGDRLAARSAEPVEMQLDSSMRVVRVLIDGRPNTRLSRTMYGRSGRPRRAAPEAGRRLDHHPRSLPRVRAGRRAAGHRARGGSAPSWRPVGSGARSWLPVPLDPRFERATATFRIQTSVGQRAIAPGVLEKVDTLPYDHAVWRYRMDEPAPVAALAVASGSYRIRSAHAGTLRRWVSRGRGLEPRRLGRRGLTRGRWSSFSPGRWDAIPIPRLVHVEAAVPAAFAAPGIVLHPQGSLSGRRPRRFRAGARDGAPVVRGRRLSGTGRGPGARGCAGPGSRRSLARSEGEAVQTRAAGFDHVGGSGGHRATAVAATRRRRRLLRRSSRIRGGALASVGEPRGLRRRHVGRRRDAMSNARCRRSFDRAR